MSQYNVEFCMKIDHTHAYKFFYGRDTEDNLD